MQGASEVATVKGVDLDTGIAAVEVNAADQVAAFESIPAILAAGEQAGFQAQPFFETPTEGEVAEAQEKQA